MPGPKVFISYSHRDSTEFLEGIRGHLDALEKRRKIESWDDREIEAGAKWREEIRVNLEAADVIVFFLSPGWFASANCDDEFVAAEVREQRGEARIIPFLVRDMEYYEGTHFGNRNPLPMKGSLLWAVELWEPHFNSAYRTLVKELTRLAEAMPSKPEAQPDPGERIEQPEPAPKAERPEQRGRPAVRGRYGIALTAQHFVGREHLVETLESELRAQQRPFVAIVGPPGYGKTAVAAEHVRHRAADYDVVAWVQADTDEHLTRGYAGLAQVLGLAATDTAARGGVRKWLGEHDRWLLVLDNAVAPEKLEGFVPDAWGGHVIVTSRNHGWHALGTELEVHELELSDAAEYLMRSTGADDMDAAVELAELLDRVPLSLVLAAKKVRTDGVSLREYAARLRAREELVA